MSDLKVGIAGFGVVGKRRKNCIARHPRLRVVAVCDQTFEDEGVLADGVRYYRDYRRLLTESLDVLFVCLTNDIAARGDDRGPRSAACMCFARSRPGASVEDIVKVIACERRHPRPQAHVRLQSSLP